MTTLIESLLAPLPLIDRITAQETQPIFFSAAMEEHFGTRLNVRFEMPCTDGYLFWTKSSIGADVIPEKRALSRKVYAVSQEVYTRSLSRLIPENTWMLLGYLCKSGWIDVPIRVRDPITCSGQKYIAYWGAVEPNDLALHFILRDTPQRSLRQLLDNAFVLVSER